MNILINYADKMHYQAQKRNSATGKIFGFDKVIEWNRNELEPFLEKNSKISNQPRGAGYWIWKPYIIYKSLLDMGDDDILFYCDSGCDFIESIKDIAEVCRNDKKGLILFEGAHVNKKYTKRDCFTLMGCDTPYFTDRLQLTASFHLCRKTKFTLSFYEEFIKYAEDERILTDIDNFTGNNYPEFIDHRHDQSILTNLAIKYNVTLLQDPSQWGDLVREKNLKTIIYHHRSKA